MACRNICTRYKIMKDRRGFYYEQGHKRCAVGQVFIDWQRSKCPCCGFMLRIRPRHQPNMPYPNPHLLTKLKYEPVVVV